MERSYWLRIAGLAVVWGAWASAAMAATNIWDGDTDGSWTDGANWVGNVPLVDGESVEFYSVGNNLSTLLGQDWIINRLIFNAGADSAVTIAGANTLTLSNGIIVDADSAGAHAILANVALAQNQTWTINTNTSTLGNNLLVGGVISGNATLTKAGTGILTLTNQNTFTGGLTLSLGKLRVGHDDALGSGTLTWGGVATLSSDSTEARRITNAVALTGNITLGDATDNGALTFTGPMSLGNAVRTLNVNSLVTNSGVISGTGTAAGILKGAGGTLVLAGTNNSFAGAVQINQGTVVVASLANVGTNSSLGTGVGTSLIRMGNNNNAGILEYVGEGASTDRQVQIGSGNVGNSGGATINNNGSGPLVFSASAFNVAFGTATGARALTLGGSNADTNTIIGAIIDNSALGGIVSLTKAGTGNWVVLGPNSFSGQVLINGGTLTVNTIAGAGTNSALGTGVSNAVVRMGNNNNTGTLEYIGSGATTDRQVQIGSGTVGNTGGATILNNGTGALVFSATDFNSPFATATGTRALTLGGSNAGPNAILGAIIDNVGVTTTGRVNVSKIDAGTWILAGTNTYTGATTIGGGTLIVTGGLAIGDLSAVTLSNVAGALLQLRSDETIGSLAGGDGIGGTVDLGGNTLTVGGNNISTIFGGTITNTGALVKQGTGTMALTNDNTYSGPTTVAGGTLVLGSANALPGGIGTVGGNSALILTNGGALGLGAGDFTRELGTGPSNVAWTGGGGFSAYGGTRVVNIGGGTQQLSWGQANFVSNDNELVLASADATGTIDFQNHIVLSGTNRFRADNGTQDIDGRLSGDLSGSGSFLKTGLGVIELAGSNTYFGGTEIAGGDLLFSGANSLSPNTWLTISNFGVVTLGAADFTNALGSGSAGVVEWTGSGGFAAHGADRFVNLGGATGQVTWGSGFFVPEAVDNSTLVLGSAAASNTVDFQNPIVLGFSNRTVQVNDGFAAIDGKLSGVLSGSALETETNFTKTGAGTLALSAANTYTGLTVVSAGALRAQNNAALGVTNGGTIVNSGSALEMEGGITIGAEDLTLGGTGIGGAGALRNVSGSNVFQGNVFLSANTTFGSDAGILVLDGDAILGAEGTARAVTFNGPGDFVVNSLVSNATTFNKIVGTGTLTLNGASLHTGNTVIREGTLKLGADDVLPENSTYVANLTGSFANLDIAGRTDAIGALILGQNPTADGSTNNVIDSGGGGLLRLGGNVTYDASGGDFTNAGSVISANLDLNNATRVFSVEDSALATDDLLVSGTITNSGATAAGIRKDGAGTLVFSGSNTYDGLTSVNGGTLVAANNQAFGSVGYISMTNTGARLELANGITIDRNMIVENRAENKTLAIRGGASVATYSGDITILETTANNFDLSADAGGTLTISGVIGGTTAAGVEKVGAGTVVLASNNTYSGQTTISGGVLQVGNGGVSGTLGGGAVTNNSALVFNRSDTITVANAIRGTGTLTNAGAGKTILTAANNFSGGSVISDGALELRAATSGGTGDIRLNGGDLWLLNNSGTTYGNDIFVDVNGSLFVGRTTLGAAVTHTVGDVTLGAGRTLIVRGTNLNNNANYTLAAGDLILAGDGTLDIREGPGTGDGTFRVDNVLAGGAGQDLRVKGNDVNQSQFFVNSGLYVGGNLTIGTNALVRTPDGATNVVGNINLAGGALGLNMNFARELGTGAGQVRFTLGGTFQSGFSAFDSPVVVRIEDGSGNLTNLVWGSSTFNPGQLMLNQDDANSTIELQNDIDFNSGAGAVARTINVYANVATISGGITNSGVGTADFVKGGGGTLSLTGPTDWNGQTRIGAGTLRLTNVTALATSFASSNLFLNPGNAIGVLETQGLLTNALGGGVDQVRIVGGGNAGQNSRPGFSAYGGDLTIDLGGDGTGTGSQLVWGSADFNVSGPSTNNGALLLNTVNADGTVRLMNDIDLNGQDLFLAGPDYRRIEVNGSTAVLGGDISNNGTDPVGILKRGAGTLVMAGYNTYDGLTEVVAGSLLVGGSHFWGGDYNVAANATLGGTGTIGSAVLIASNAVMSPGNSIGTFTTTNNFTFSTGGVLQIELDHVLAASDRLVVSGALDIAGAILSLTNLGAGGDLASLDDTYIIAEYGSLIGDTFFNHTDVLGLLPVGYEIAYNYLGANQIALVIPEPGSVVALMLGGIGLTLLGRRRRMASRVREENV